MGPNQKFKNLISLLLAMLIVILSACTQDNGNGSVAIKSSDVDGIRIPAAIHSVGLTNGTLHAYITVDGDSANRREMNITADRTAATLVLNDIQPGDHVFTIDFEFDSTLFNLNGIKLATASKTLTVVANQANPLNFVEGDYDMSFDDNGNSIPNIDELLAGNNPGPYGPCIIGDSQIGSCTL